MLYGTAESVPYKDLAVAIRALQRDVVVQRLMRNFRSLAWPMTGASLELHLCSESEDDSTLPAPSHVRVVLDHGLQKEHW
jgi:hypothetical protein